MRFHQAVQFLPVEEARALVVASDQLGYSGAYFSDHLFNPRVLASRYTYSTAPDGAPSSRHRQPPPVGLDRS